jgi:hypothetical protein
MATDDPLSTVALVGVIVAMAGFIVRMFQSQITDRDRRIEKLEGEVGKMAERSASLAESAEKMLDYFLEKPSLPRDDPPGNGGRRQP